MPLKPSEALEKGIAMVPGLKQHYFAYEPGEDQGTIVAACALGSMVLGIVDTCQRDAFPLSPGGVLDTEFGPKLHDLRNHPIDNVPMSLAGIIADLNDYHWTREEILAWLQAEGL